MDNLGRFPRPRIWLLRIHLRMRHSCTVTEDHLVLTYHGCPMIRVGSLLNSLELQGHCYSPRAPRLTLPLISRSLDAFRRGKYVCACWELLQVRTAAP